MDKEANPYINQNALFEWIVNSTDDAIICKDLKGNILTWNKAAEKIFGYTQEEISHKNISILIPEDLRLEEELLIRKIKTGQIVDHYETRRVKKDGSLVDVSLTLSPVKNLKGEIVGVSKILSDITEKKKVALALQESEKRFRSIVENSKDIIILMNEKYEVVYRSPSAIAITGYTIEEIDERIQRGEVINQVHPDDQAAILIAIQKIKESVSVPVFLSFRTQHKDGHYVWLEGTITNHLANPALNAFVQNLQDVTEKKISEIQFLKNHEQLKKLTEKIPIAILKMETNSSGHVKILFVSKGIQNIYPDYNQEDILLNGDLITDHITDEDKIGFYEAYYNSLNNIVDLNVEFRIKVGKVAKWVKLFYHPEIQEDGTVKWYGYLEDINLQKKFLLDLKSQNNKLKEIAWTQSHLVRAPLSRIMGLVAVLQKGLLSSDDQNKFLLHINESTKELDDVIRVITNKTSL
jgi:PAS domain S-box-containing protein